LICETSAWSPCRFPIGRHLFRETLMGIYVAVQASDWFVFAYMRHLIGGRAGFQLVDVKPDWPLFRLPIGRVLLNCEKSAWSPCQFPTGRSCFRETVIGRCSGFRLFLVFEKRHMLGRCADFQLVDGIFKRILIGRCSDCRSVEFCSTAKVLRGRRAGFQLVVTVLGKP
ncbi:unnamed protein product, partial [Laminaria digitata]